MSPSQVSRWRAGQVPDLDNADRLAGLALVVEMLSRWLPPEATEGWLNGQNAHLSDLRPGYLIRLGRVADVIGAIEAEMAPDATASRHRHITQPLARAAWDAGYHGLRWWSSFWGDWHTVVLFTARMSGGLRFGVPEVLTIHHPAVTEAAALLGMLRR